MNENTTMLLLLAAAAYFVFVHHAPPGSTSSTPPAPKPAPGPDQTTSAIDDGIKLVTAIFTAAGSSTTGSRGDGVPNS